MDEGAYSSATDAEGISATAAGRQAQDASQRDSGLHSSGGRWTMGAGITMNAQWNRIGRNESTSRGVGDASREGSRIAQSSRQK